MTTAESKQPQVVTQLLAGLDERSHDAPDPPHRPARQQHVPMANHASFVPEPNIRCVQIHLLAKIHLPGRVRLRHVLHWMVSSATTKSPRKRPILQPSRGTSNWAIGSPYPDSCSNRNVLRLLGEPNRRVPASSVYPPATARSTTSNLKTCWPISTRVPSPRAMLSWFESRHHSDFRCLRSSTPSHHG